MRLADFTSLFYSIALQIQASPCTRAVNLQDPLSVYLQSRLNLQESRMVFQIKHKSEIFKIPNFGGIPNIYFGKVLTPNPSYSHFLTKLNLQRIIWVPKRTLQALLPAHGSVSKRDPSRLLRHTSTTKLALLSRAR